MTLLRRMFLVALVLLATPALAQNLVGCTGMQEMRAQLKRVHGEIAVQYGETFGNSVMTIFVSPTDTWTLTETIGD